jgi:propanediol dehydratase small subunit
MNRAAGLTVTLVCLAAASGCSRISQVEADRSAADTTSVSTTSIATSDPPLMNEEPGSMNPQSSHNATVITNAGRIDATVISGDLAIDVTTQDGWTSDIDRSNAKARVVWRSGNRSVAVNLERTPTGITQEVVSTG